jgi:hypothetical protein
LFFFVDEPTSDYIYNGIDSQVTKQPSFGEKFNLYINIVFAGSGDLNVRSYICEEGQSSAGHVTTSRSARNSSTGKAMEEIIVCKLNIQEHMEATYTLS